MTALKSCPTLTEHDLGAAAECPHCAFRPTAARVHAAVGSRLAELDDELDTLLSTWTDVLLSNLDDPATREKLDLLRPDQRAPVQTFVDSRLLPAQPGRDVIDAVAQVLSGLSKVVVTADDLRGALFPGGSPATPGELKQRFGAYVDKKTKGRDEARVRIVIEMTADRTWPGRLPAAPAIALTRPPARGPHAVHTPGRETCRADRHDLCTAHVLTAAGAPRDRAARRPRSVGAATTT